MKTKCSVVLSTKAKRNLRKVPRQMFKKFNTWVVAVEVVGIIEVRKTKSYHDEPLQGKRFGQRSIRLSRSYRAFYRQKNDGVIELIEVLEINKHAY